MKFCKQKKNIPVDILDMKRLYFFFPKCIFGSNNFTENTCRYDRPNSIYIYQVGGLFQGHQQFALVDEERGLVMRVQEGGPMRNASSIKQSRGQKVWFAIQSNISRDSIDKDTHHESIGQREAMKYLRKSCYHRIECSAANSLIALI